jgi:hypothetical protein
MPARPGALTVIPSADNRQGRAAAVADVEHIHRFTLNGEQDAVHVRLPSVEQLPHFKRGTAHSQEREGNAPALWRVTQ